MSAVPAHLRAKGWSEAKAFAATMLRKNPNTYFYRHVVPHETQVGVRTAAGKTSSHRQCYAGLGMHTKLPAM